MTNKIGTHKTTVHRNEAAGFVQYHDTRVVEWSHNSITLNSGGWRTQTTAKRINQTMRNLGLNVTVYQKNHEWFVTYPSGTTVEFSDGMTLIV
jgi:hypothetical protein